MATASVIHQRAVTTVTPKVTEASRDSPPLKPNAKAATPKKGANHCINLPNFIVIR